jgi:carbon starvation protein
MLKKIAGVLLAVVGAFAVGGIALHRHEPINSLWLITAAVCVYLLGYRFYAAWLATRVL